MNSIGTAWVFVLLVIINLDIGGRALFNHPVRGVPEIVALSIVACVFLQIAHTLNLDPKTVTKWLAEPCYRPRLNVPRTSKLDPYKARVDALVAGSQTFGRRQPECGGDPDG